MSIAGNERIAEVSSNPILFKSPVSYVEPSKDQPRIEVDHEEDEDEIEDV